MMPGGNKLPDNEKWSMGSVSLILRSIPGELMYRPSAFVPFFKDRWKIR